MRRIGTKRRTQRIALVALALGWWAGAAAARQGEDATAAGRAEVRRLMTEDGVPGVAVAVMENGELLWSEGFGFANLEHQAPVTPRTRFRIGSISKALTSVAIGLLVHEGRLDLDLPVQTYVPTFPEKRFPITTRQLAGHLSGLPHYGPLDFINTKHYSSVTAALDKFKDRPLLFEPGERFEYSSFGWNLIAAVVEGASGQEFLELMEDRVFRPLDMPNTVADRYARVIEHRTAFYQLSGSGEVRNAPAVDNSDVWAAGGFLSTAEDLVRFGHGLLTSELLAPETKRLLFTSMTTNDGEPTGYGLGWRLGELTARPTLEHGGSHIGASARLILVPDEGLVIAVLANVMNRRTAGVAGTIAERFLGPEPH